MLALAIVLLLIVAVLVVASFAGSSEELVIEFLNVTVTTSVGGVFVTGVVCGLVALASALALRRSWRLQQARAAEVRELRRLAGIPDPDGAESPTADTESKSQAAADDTEGADGDRSKSGAADAARANVTASSGDSDDTAPLPEPEDPPRT